MIDRRTILDMPSRCVRMSNLLREVSLRKVVLVAVLSALAIPARAQSMQVYGKTEGTSGSYA